MPTKGISAAPARNVIIQLHLDEDGAADEGILSYFSHMFVGLGKIFCRVRD
jgi:hypothetical protein